jgi:uncharacterized delta-60 repeat protein
MRARSSARARRALLAGVVAVGSMALAPSAGAGGPDVTGRPGSVGEAWSEGSDSDGATTASRGPAAEPAASGDLDTTWAGDGVGAVQTRYLPEIAGHSAGRLAVALYKEADGLGRFRVWDFLADGTPDPGWGSAGYVLRTFRAGGVSFPHEMEPYQGGHIVIGSWNGGGVARLGITRLRPGGAYRGLGSYPGRSVHKVFTFEHDYLVPFSTTVVGNGHLLIAVAAFDASSAGDLVYVGQAIMRVNGLDARQPSFSGDGILPVAKDVMDVAFRSDGGIYMGRVVGGSHEIRKLRPDGTPDPTFSGDGRALVPCGAGHLGADLEVDSSGRVVVTCINDNSGSVANPSPNLRIARMTLTGALDTTYSGNGLAALDLNGVDFENWTLAVAPDGSVYAGGAAKSNDRELRLRSLDATGEPNLAFSGDGSTSIAVDSPLIVLGSSLSGNRLFLASGRGTVYIDLLAVSLL